MKLRKVKKRTAEYRIPNIANVEGWSRFAKSFLKQTEYIHSTFDVRCSLVYFSIKLAAAMASGRAKPLNPEPITLGYINLDNLCSSVSRKGNSYHFFQPFSVNFVQ